MTLIDPSLVARFDPPFEATVTTAQRANTSSLRGNFRLRAVLQDERGEEEKGENADHEQETGICGEYQEVGGTRPDQRYCKESNRS